jgi:phospholipid transport system transporter-binding protein
MASVQLKDMGAGRFSVHGSLTFETAADALEQSKATFSEYDRLTVDLAEVSDADSAGLALLLEWINWARHYVREIRFENVPKQILAIARISEVTDLLTAGERWVSQDVAAPAAD